MSLDASLQIYISESRELLEEMERALLQLEQGDVSDREELLNAIFRAAHTIKGSAGLFGLEDIIAFTHGVESVLDRLRSDQIRFDQALVALLLTCHDHIGALVSSAEVGAVSASWALLEQSDRLTEQLQPYLSSAIAFAALDSQIETTGFALDMIKADPDQGYVERMNEESVVNDCWHISIRFGRDSLRDGMDPLSVLRYLETLGNIEHIVTLDCALPETDTFDPENCYLGFEIQFNSSANKQAIEDVFEYIRESSQIRIVPPHGMLAEYITLIQKMPEEDLRLGEMLVKCGALTQHELDNALTRQNQVREHNQDQPLGEIVAAQDSTLRPVLAAAIQKQSQIRAAFSQDNQSIRVDADKLDVLINLVGELVTAGASTAQNAKNTGDAAMIESVTVLASLLEAVRDAALRLRMVQIGATFNRFQRVVRDVSKELNKEITLVISGADTELDKTVVEKIGDPLMHLVRNAIDHGIDSAESRIANGKPATGTVQLNAYHDSGNIVIEVSDDGAGLNYEAIRAKALQKGLISEEQILTPNDLHNLIFEPGFSTADAVTNLSGRGVGMDVVRRNIEELRGRVEVESEPGIGSTFRIIMPLTLAIIDGFMVGVASNSFVIPLDAVSECIELPQPEQNDPCDKRYINLRGGVLPLIHLRELFAIQGAATKRSNIVVVHSAGRMAGLVVDRLMGEFQTVIKPLGKIFSHVQGVGGSTIMGNGEVALILDVPNLIQQVTSKEQRSIAMQHCTEFS